MKRTSAVHHGRRRRGRSPELMLSSADFRHEIRLERMRADRRQIPFCVVKLVLCGQSRSRLEMRKFVQLIARNVRATDERALLGRYVLGLLLVDTPEAGGQAAVRRLEGLAARMGFDARIHLRTYAPTFVRRVDDSDDSDSDGFLSIASQQHDHDESASAECAELDFVCRAVDASLERSEQPNIRVDSPIQSDFVSPTIYQRFAKRTIDLIGAATGLVISSPLLIASMIAIRATSEGPAIFTQMREGRDGIPFRIYKLRTMYIDAEARQASLRQLSERDGPAFKMKNDPRVTKVGKFLRATCIDELPQLINVLRGDMSLVGPRPLPVAESRACQSWHRRRLDVLPGLTCDWQINKSQAETFDDWMRLDLSYIDRNSLARDLWLIVRTFKVPVGGRGGD